MPIKSLEDVFVQELQDMLSAERQVARSLPKLAEMTENEQLREGFELHREQTQRQIERLEQIFELLDRKPRAKKCEAMEAILGESMEMLEKIDDPQVCDAVMIAGSQKVEHYEICSYGTLAAWAEQLGMTDAARLLQETLAEEKATDEKLTALAVSHVNEEATAPSE